ncbi:MAG: PspC domain-containing protein [Gordonia sp. (in: high G+C Gram-positive bacteria)]
METTGLRPRLEDMWATRPVRPSVPRTAAGVCVGIADRYRVDPILVKVAFVVATIFGGSGLLVYLAAWIAFPSGAPAPNQHEIGRRHHGGPSILLLMVVIVVVISALGSHDAWNGGSALGVILLLIAWWLLYQRTPEAPAGTGVVRLSSCPTVPTRAPVAWSPLPDNLTMPGVPPVVPADTPVAPTKDVGLTKDVGAASDVVSAPPPPPASPPPASPPPASPPPASPPPASDPLETTPPAWDPLGTARFAWDLPEPGTPELPAPARDRRSPLTVVVLGMTVIVGGLGAALNRVGVGWFTVSHTASLMLAVVGAGLITGAFLRRGTRRPATGLIPVAFLLGAVVVASTVAAHWDSGVGVGVPSGGVGERRWQPPTENDIHPEYSLGMGTAELDLRAIDLTHDRTVTVTNGVGEVHVRLPANMDVRTECSVGLGDYTCPDGLDGGPDGVGGPVLTITAHTGMGTVAVTR